MAQQKVKIILPKGYTPAQRREIGQEIIEFIQDRAIEKNTGFNPDTGRNKRFPSYSKQYAEKKGTSRGDVDLIFSGEMFNEMQVLNDTSDSVTIGFEAGTEANGKAEGNQKGTYGRPKADPKKARPFLGIQQNDLRELLNKYDSDIEVLSE